MVTWVGWFRMAEAHLRWCPVGAGSQATASYPDRKKKFRALPWCGHAARHDVAQRRLFAINVELDAGRLMDEALISAEALVARAERLAQEQSIEVHVERSGLGVFSDVESQVGIARDIDRVRDERQDRAPRHMGIGITKRGGVDSGGGEQGSGIAAERLQARHERSDGPYSQVRFGRGHAGALSPFCPGHHARAAAPSPTPTDDRYNGVSDEDCGRRR